MSPEGKTRTLAQKAAQRVLWQRRLRTTAPRSIPYWVASSAGPTRRRPNGTRRALQVGVW